VRRWSPHEGRPVHEGDGGCFHRPGHPARAGGCPVHLADAREWWQALSVPSVSREALQEPIRRQLYRVLARRSLQWDSGSAVVEWANAALTDGWDCTPIAILAGLDIPLNEFETDRYLRDALEELKIHPPEREDLIRVLALIIAEDILSGAASPKEGCHELSKLAWTEGYPEWLMDFYSADNALDLAEQGVYGSVDGVSQDIVAASLRLVEAAP
jgi:hypothetical protein